MLSQITFILSLALLASCTERLIGTWRYEGQFVVGNPKLNWDMAGWKLVMDVVVSASERDRSRVSVQFINPLVLSVNDRVHEKTVWTQINKMNWIQTGLEDLKKTFTVSFLKNTVEGIICGKTESIHAIDFKVGFAHHLQAALWHKDSMNKTHNYMGLCDTRVNITMKNSSHLNDSVPSTGKVVSTIYQHCDCSHFPIVGVIPIAPTCSNCELYPWKLPLDSYNKIEIVKSNEVITSVIRQDVVALPIYQTDSPEYSIYGNVSLIRVKSSKPRPLPITLDEKANSSVMVHLNDSAYSHSHNKYQAKFIHSTDEIIVEAVKLIHTIISGDGHLKIGENIYALYDLLTEYKWLITTIESRLTTSEERKVFYSLLITQESSAALEVLMQAILKKKIPLPAVPVIMILSAKVTAMTDMSAFCTFIHSIQKECPFCAEVSYLAMSIVIRRNKNPLLKSLRQLKCMPTDPRWELAIAGNIGLNLDMKIPVTNVTMKIAYVQSKRALKTPVPRVYEELLEIFMDPKEDLVVRIETFKVIVGLTCDKTVWSSIAARINEINDHVLINYVISYMETLASLKLPVYCYMARSAQKWLPMWKVRKTNCLSSKSIALSTYDPLTNMGVAVLADYAIPQKADQKYAIASLEIRPLVLNSLLSVWKVQVIIPKAELMTLIETIRILNMRTTPIKLIYEKLLPLITALVKKSELKIFNDDMEILIINSSPKLLRWIDSLIPMLSMSGRIRGCAVPIVVKKTIPSLLGPQVVMSLVNYISVDTIYEILTKPSLGFTVLPRISAGIRFRLKASNKVAMDIGTQIKAVIDSKKITAEIRREGNTSLRVITRIPLQITPVASLQVIPSTSNQLGAPPRVWEERTTPSLWTKTIPINLVAKLAEPAIVLNITGEIAKPLNQKWLYALQSPQTLQVYLLPSYKLPSDVIFVEWILAKNQCPSPKYCLWKDARPIGRVRWCQRLCINALDIERKLPSPGSAITVMQNSSFSVFVDSRINISGCTIGKFIANVGWTLPAMVTPVHLFNNSYRNMLKAHKFITVPSMQQTLRETEITSQLKKVLTSLFLVESREEDYADMHKDIMNLYPQLYFNDTLKIRGLHGIMKKLLEMSSKALKARSQIYTPAWDQIETVKQNLLSILKNPLKQDLPDVVVMQDHVILWCVMKYYEIVHDCYEGCNRCNEGKEFIHHFKTTLFQVWKKFYHDSKNVVKKVLPQTEKLNNLVTLIFNTDELLIKLIDFTGSTPILNQYRNLARSLETINGKLRGLSVTEKMLASKTIMVKLVGFDLLKSLGDHWHVHDDKKEEIKVNTAKTDLGTTFMSVAARIIIQSSALLGDKKDLETYKVNVLINQAIQLIDYKRWLRMAFMDDAELPKLQNALKILVKRTNESLAVLNLLPLNITSDPMWHIFVTGVMAAHRLTILELKNVPKYALYESKEFEMSDLEWKLTTLIKMLMASDRPWSTLKRGIMKEPDTWLRSSRPEPIPTTVNLFGSIEWPGFFKLGASVIAQKSDSQVIREIQEATMSRSWTMVRSMHRFILNKNQWLDPLLWELNTYRDIATRVSVEGHLPEHLKTTLSIWTEKFKTTVVPFEASLSAEDIAAVKADCPTEKCLRMVISRDNKKVDFLWRDPLEIIQLLQLPTGWNY